MTGTGFLLGDQSLGRRFSQIWLQTRFEAQNCNHASTFFGYTPKTKCKNLAIFYFIFPSFLTDN